MPRLFTGLEIPADLAQRLSLLRGGLAGARWIDAENYHVTLRFIGDIDDRTADEIADAMARVRRREFDLQLAGLDSFGTAKPHSIVARIAPSRALTELQAEQERIIQRIGLPPEGRKYTPHVTLARLRNTPHRDVADYLTLRGGLVASPFHVGRFVLFSSKASTGGGPYIVEQAYPLAEYSEARG
ncbi:RNA 2',3'-cyclic phosphodiesterase [Kaistia sp. 32K]|uniref:RNA 2',3'-cyclic phosphodiesterase n=1 Tax=Kaistia sp. 32K TaxID=2795690 RepID=UPI0019168789|nr:RNA 2',3'-cyclic phosphodiesterase [Kaistia sp. 32K]BCP55664.1 RNA 2',3'-cyclic phosphodiesterase [Kaistia sp. 32K]